MPELAQLLGTKFRFLATAMFHPSCCLTECHSVDTHILELNISRNRRLSSELHEKVKIQKERKNDQNHSFALL